MAENSKSKNKLLVGLALSLGVSVLMIFIHYSGKIDPLENGLLDQKFRVMERADTNKNVVIVALDQSSLNNFDERFGLKWPLPREVYGRVLEYLVNDGAKVVAFDILFDRAEFDRLDTDGPASDRKFAKALSESGRNVISALVAEDSAAVVETTNSDKFLLKYPENKFSENSPGFSSYPIELFTENATSIGAVNMPTDADGVIRRINVIDPIGDSKAIMGLALAAYMTGKQIDDEVEFTPENIKVGDLSIPLDKHGQYIVNWYKKGGVVDGTFDYYPIYQVLVSSLIAARDSSRSRPFEPGTFKNKYIFIGASALGLSDTRSTPFSALEPFPGVEIHATAAANLLDGVFIKQIPSWLMSVVIVALNVLIVWLVFYKPIGLSGIGGVVILLLINGISFWIFGFDRVWVPSGILNISAITTFIPALAYRYYSEERQKQEIKSAFSRYVQKEVVAQLMAHPDKLKLGGEKRKLTIMFSDLAGFTTISESMSPEDLVILLNEYLGAMTRIIFEYNGTLDKYIGDAIMAFWGAPLDQEEQELMACRSVLAMIDKLNVMRVDWLAKGLPDVFARYGVNTGLAIAGNMGSDTRFNYTVMGDTVNLAARLEPANKVYNTTAMISESTYNAVKSELVCRQLDKMVVKGKTLPVTVYELIARKEELEQNKSLKETMSLFQDGLDLYYDRQFLEACIKFEKILEVWPDDGPSKLYVSRSQQYMRTPPSKDWNGVFTMTTK